MVETIELAGGCFWGCYVGSFIGDQLSSCENNMLMKKKLENIIIEIYHENQPNLEIPPPQKKIPQIDLLRVLLWAINEREGFDIDNIAKIYIMWYQCNAKKLEENELCQFEKSSNYEECLEYLISKKSRQYEKSKCLLRAPALAIYLSSVTELNSPKIRNIIYSELAMTDVSIISADLYSTFIIYLANLIKTKSVIQSANEALRFCRLELTNKLIIDATNSRTFRVEICDEENMDEENIYVQFQMAIHVTTFATSFDQGLQMAVRLGGCVERNLPVVCSALGARFGRINIPIAWIRGTDLAEKHINNVIRQIIMFGKYNDNNGILNKSDMEFFLSLNLFKGLLVDAL